MFLGAIFSSTPRCPPVPAPVSRYVSMMELALAIALIVIFILAIVWLRNCASRTSGAPQDVPELLACIRARRSVFPRSYVMRAVPPATMSQ